MTTERTSQPDLSARMQAMVAEVRTLSERATSGDVAAGVELLSGFVPGQDEDPRFPTTDDGLIVLTSSQRLAFILARFFTGEFANNFGFDSELGYRLTPEDPAVQGYVKGLGMMLDGMLNPGRSYPNQAMIGMEQMNESFVTMLTWANLQE